MSTTFERNETVQRDWYVVDATDRIVGRFATHLATVLMGKHKPCYTPHVDCGDFIVVTNVERVVFSGASASDKDHPGMTVRMARKEYDSYSGYPSGRKVRTGSDLIDRKPEFILYEAVRRMLPKNRLGRQMLKKLKLVVGPDHDHQAQQPAEMPAWMLGE